MGDKVMLDEDWVVASAVEGRMDISFAFIPSCVSSFHIGSSGIKGEGRGVMSAMAASCGEVKLEAGDSVSTLLRTERRLGVR